MKMLPKLRYLFLLLILIIFSGMVAPRATAQEDDTPPLDIILLLDTSGSTILERDLIEQAAKFLLDYLDANVDFVNLDYRLGVAGFNQDINQDSVIRLGRPSPSNLSNFFIDTPAGGDTDFKIPLEFALSEFDSLKSLNGDRTPIVILMTDGQPASGGEVLPDLDSYFGELGQTVSATDDAGIQVFVVGVGGAQADEDRWLGILSQDDRYEYIDDSSNLSEVYWRILSEFIEGTQDEVVELTADQAYDIYVEPYVDELTITVLKDAPGANVKIVNPDGNIYEKAPARGGGEEDLHEIYVITTPEKGDWQITLEGANGRLLVNRRHPQITLSTENPAVAVGNEFSVQATLDSESLAELDPERLTLLLAEEDKSYEEYDENNDEDYDELVFELLEDGSYEIVFEGFDEPDDYDLAPILLVDGKLLESVNTEGVSLKAVELPHIVYLDTDELLDGSHVIEYDIENDEAVLDLIPELKVFMNGELLIDEDLESHRVSSENTIDDFPIEQDGEYEIVLHIEGVSPDNLNYSDTFKITIKLPQTPIPVVETPTTVPTITATPRSVFPVPPPAPIPPNQEPKLPNLFRISGLYLGLLIIILLLLGIAIHLVLQSRKNGQNPEPDVPQPLPPPTTPPVASMPPQKEEASEISKLAQKQIEKIGEIPNDKVSVAKNQYKIEIDQVLKDGGKYTDQILIFAFEQLYSEVYKSDIDKFFDDFVKNQIREEGNKENIQTLLNAVAPVFYTQWRDSRAANSEIQFKAVKTIYESLLKPDFVDLDQLANAFGTQDAPVACQRFFNRLKVNPVEQTNGTKYEGLTPLDGSDKTILHQLYKFLGEISDKHSLSVDYQHEYKSLVDNQPEKNIEVLSLFIEEIKPIFQSSEKNQNSSYFLETYKEKLNEVRKKVSSSEYNGLPEQKLFLSLLDRWDIQVETRLRDFADIRDPVMPGQLYLQLRPSLELLSSLSKQIEESENFGTWYYNFHGILFHAAGSDITQAHLRCVLREGHPPAVKSRREGHSPAVKSKELLVLERLSSEEYTTFQYNFRAIEELEVDFSVDYETSGVYGVSVIEESIKNESIYKGFTVGVDYQSHILENEETLPDDVFIIGRPLTPEELLKSPISSAKHKVEEILRFLSGRHFVPGLIILDGLRQSGKSSIIQGVLSKVDSQRFSVIKLDLWTWWHQEIKGKDLKKDQDFHFWQRFVRVVQTHIDKEFDDLHNDLQELLNNRTWSDLKNFIHNWCTKTGRPILLVLDDADIIRNFPSDEKARLLDQLKSLLQTGNLVLWVANDDRADPWLTDLKRQFRHEVQKRNERAALLRVSTEMASIEESLFLFKEAKLTLTHMGAIVLNAFTGGWISYIQILGNEIKTKINNQQKLSQQKLSHGDTPSTVVSGEIIREFINKDNMLSTFQDYISNSFGELELELLMLLVETKTIDPKTGILTGVKFNQLQWKYPKSLKNKFDERVVNIDAHKNDERVVNIDAHKNLIAVLDQLRRKGVLDNFRYKAFTLPIIYLRPGWLYSYMLKMLHARRTNDSVLNDEEDKLIQNLPD